MKTRILYGLAAILPLCASAAVTLSANFNNAQNLTSTYIEGGLTFSATTPFIIIQASNAPYVIAGDYTSLLSLRSADWMTISGPTLSSLSFAFGSPMGDIAIGNGMVDVNLQWEAYRGGALIDSFTRLLTRPLASFTVAVGVIEAAGFDSLRLRANTTWYEGDYRRYDLVDGQRWEHRTVAHATGSQLAIDNVSAVGLEQQGLVASVPDGGSAAVMLICALGVLGWRRWV